MARMNLQHYLEVKNQGFKCIGSKGTYRNWWLIKDRGTGGNIALNNISFRREHIGKRIRIKIEFID